ncbi:MAG: LacI family transcriptional regulator [Lachnospiraceae bacterium]|nr:LacI family transcriptional regulator [Lachnospiraceae bacterium]
MKEIAAACGVSVATVSKALSGHRDIGEKTKAQVREMADKMGYLPNLSARYLKTNRSYNIGVLFEDAAHSGLTHDFFAGVLENLKITAESKGYDITFLNTSSTDMPYVERALYRGFDGVVIACSDFSDPKVQELLQSSVKVVTVDYIADNRTAVVSDNTDGMTQLMNYILNQGHRKIAYIHGDNNRVTKQRLASYYRAMRQCGEQLPADYVQPGLYRDRQLACEKTELLLSMKEPPTCILYPDDVAAYGGMNAIHARGLRVPEDISVAGYDGIRALQYNEPRLTTIRQDTESLGRLAAESLIEEIEQPMIAAPTIHTVKSVLLEGQTVLNCLQNVIAGHPA